jgi:hypothetical protein
MATAVYFMSLGLASGVVGLWCRRLLASFGFLHGFEATLWVVAFIAVAYLATQTSFRAAIMLLKPVRARSFTITEILSESAALLLVPSLAGIVLPLPNATLQKVEPFFHFGIFVGLHCFFKLMSFFAAVQGQPASRLRFLPWIAVSGLCGIAGYGIVDQYLEAIYAEQPMVKGVKEPFAANETYTEASKAPEHTRILLSLEEQQGDRISFLWAPLEANESFPETVYVTYAAYDTLVDPETPQLPSPVFSATHTLQIENQNWIENSFERADLPDGMQTLAVSWSSGEPDSIMQRYGLSPTVESGLAMMVSGPWQYSSMKSTRNAGIVVVVVEGLGAENMNLYGYHRNTVPFLTERLQGMMVYEEAYTPTPQTSGACMSLFTGVNPLAHRYYDTFNGPLPDKIKTLPEVLRDAGYLTAAFTEGRGADGNDLYYGSGFERGFVSFNDMFQMEIRASRRADAVAPVQPTPAGAWATLQNAGNWIEEHLNDQYMVFIRLRDLRNPAPLPYYGNGFIGQGRRPDPVDIYDTAVTYVDKQVSAFVDRLHEIPADQRPALIITSSHGFDFTEPGRGAWRRGGPPRRTLQESALRIPLLLDIPNRYGSTQRNLVSLEDVAVTIAGLANTSFPYPVEGVDILNQSSMQERISMAGNPVSLSLRTGHWRFTWQSGLAPFTLSSVNGAEVLDFLDITRYRANLAPVDNMRRDPRLAQSFIEKMQTFLFKHKEKSE